MMKLVDALLSPSREFKNWLKLHLIKIQIMKKFLISIAIVLTLLITGCKNEQNPTPDADKKLSIDSMTTANDANYDSTEINVEGSDGIPEPSKAQLLYQSKIVESKKYAAAVLAPTSINLFEENGKQEIIIFGEPDTMVIPRMIQYIGKPNSDTSEGNCNGKRVSIVKWDEYISLIFVNRNGQSQFAGWNLQSRDEYATRFKTTSGLTVGVKRTKLNTPMSQKPTKTSLGYLHRPESVTAILTSPDDDAIVTYLFSGINCYAIEEGKTPESEKN
jgi:hypothetical protein